MLQVQWLNCSSKSEVNSELLSIIWSTTPLLTSGIRDKLQQETCVASS